MPDEVAIDEAIETAKQYCGADAPGFVNGILGAAMKRAEPGGTRAPSDGGERLADLASELEEAADAAPRRARPRRGRASWRRAAPSSRRRRRSSSTGSRSGAPSAAPGPGGAALSAAAVTGRRRSGDRRLSGRPAQLVEDYLRELRFSSEPRDRGPRRGDALLAAGRRQADPAGADARDRARARRATRSASCRPPPRSS